MSDSPPGPSSILTIALTTGSPSESTTRPAIAPGVTPLGALRAGTILIWVRLAV